MDALSDLTGLSNWQTDSLTNLNNVFATGPSNSPSLTNLSGLENWNTSKVTDMGYMFNDLKSLTDISALANWDFSSVNTLQRAFRHTSIETTDGLGNKTFNNLKSLEGLFFECTSLKDISDLATWDGTFKRTQKALECLLRGCTNLESLDGLDSPLFNNASNDGSGFSLSHTFDNCKKVTDLSPITNWNTDGLMKMDYTFVGVSMTDVNPIQNWDVTDVQSLRACFWKCSQLNDISALAAWGTKVHNVNDGNKGMDETFADCYSLTDMSALNDWELYHTSLTKFNNMIKGISSTNSVHPEWTKITGSWQNATFNKTGTVLGTLGLYDNTNKLGEIKVVGE